MLDCRLVHDGIPEIVKTRRPRVVSDCNTDVGGVRTVCMIQRVRCKKLRPKEDLRTWPYIASLLSFLQLAESDKLPVTYHVDE